MYIVSNIYYYTPYTTVYVWQEAEVEKGEAAEDDSEELKAMQARLASL